MPTIEKEVIRPGTYFYVDEKTGAPCKLVVTAEMCKRWHDEGNRMLSCGLTVPVPFEHDFNAHPMTPRDKIANNSGWIKGYKLRGDALFSDLDIQDDEIAKKLPRTIRWTSPWINSFTDGEGRKWDNVISHLALTTRPRIIRQEPFPSIAAALSLAAPNSDGAAADGGYCLSGAARLVERKRDKQLRPQYPMAFSLATGGVKLKEEKPGDMKALKDDGDDVDDDGDDDGDDMDIEALANPALSAPGEVKMEELLCDLLQALGVPMPDESNESEFKRHLYEAAMSKIKELTSQGMANKQKEPPPDQNKPPAQQPNASGPHKAPNPLIPQVQQEQQPMYMSLEEINKIEDTTMRTVALSMYKQNEELRHKLEANERTTNAMRDAKLAEEAKKRQTRIQMLSRLSPKVKDHLDAMVAQQSMALSMGDDGGIRDPMKATLDTLEAGLATMPAMLTVDRSGLTVVPQPSDAEALSSEGENALVESMVRMMGGEQPASAG